MNSLKQIPLFNTFTEKEIEEFLKDQRTQTLNFKAKETIAQSGDPCHGFGIVLEGQVQVMKLTASGNQSIIKTLEKGELFGEMAVFGKKLSWPATVITKTKTQILMLNFKDLFEQDFILPEIYIKLFYNLLGIFAQRTLYLNQRLNYLFLKTIREKIALYLLNTYQEKKQLMFQVNLNRNELAEFLNITRPSLSRELIKLKDEGFIDYSGRSFKILNLKDLESILL